MNLDLLQTKLLAAARQPTPSDRVPYAFEQRVMARLRQARPKDWLSTWAAGLWRAALPCLAIAVALVAANFVIPDGPTEIAANDTLEVALFAAADPTSDF